MSRPAQVLAVVSAGVFMASLDVTIVNIAFPHIEREFDDTSLAGLSWILNAYAIVFAALLVPAGRLADRIGRPRGFLGGLALFVAASALCAAAPSAEALVAARVVQAVGAAFLVPSSLALLLPEFPPARLPVAIGLWGATGGVAAALGPTLGGLLTELDWRWIFLMNLPVGLLAGVAGARVLRETREPATAPRPDVPGALALGAGIGLLALGIVKGSDWGWASPAVVGAIVAAGALVAAVLVRSARHPSPVVELSLLRRRTAAAANTSSVLFSMAFFAMFLAQVLYLTRIGGLSALEAGIAFSPGPVAATVVSVPSGLLVRRLGFARIAALGAALCAASFLWCLLFFDTSFDYASEFLPALLLGGAGTGLVLAPLAGAATYGLPPGRFATGSAVYQMGRQLGAALGVAVLVAILGTPDSPAAAVDAFHAGYAFMGVASAAAALAALAIGRAGSSPAAARERAGAPAMEAAGS